MEAKSFVTYELVTKFFDGKMQVAIPKEGLPETLERAGWMLEDNALLVTYNGQLERYENVPGPMQEALTAAGVLNFIDMEREVVVSLPRSFAVFSES
ncbi:hypothetical protein RYA05_03675 [Pseudomonas syringae pv. actinidiae]|nr:hypothetical protein [Pseudomonas syringae pv. actinidiae]